MAVAEPAMLGTPRDRPAMLSRSACALTSEKVTESRCEAGRESGVATVVMEPSLMEPALAGRGDAPYSRSIAPFCGGSSDQG